MKLDINHQT